MGHFGLAFEGGGVKAVALVAGDEFLVGIEGFDDFAFLFEELGLAVASLSGAWGGGVFVGGFVVEFDGSVGFSGIVGGFCFLIEGLAFSGGGLGVAGDEGDFRV